MSMLLRFRISQPAAVSWRSMFARARSSGLPVAGVVMRDYSTSTQHFYKPDRPGDLAYLPMCRLL